MRQLAICSLSLALACAETKPPTQMPNASPAATGAPAAGASAVVSTDPAPVTPLVLSHAAISSRDRVYAANQTSNTVSVIDPGGPAGGKLLGEIVLGAPRTEILSPIYRGQLNVHGLGFSPDHHTLAVVSIGSNSVTFIDTATNAVKGVAYIGRAPHEAFFTPDGKELWVAVRGENYVSVIDAGSFKETARIPVASGPGMLLFRPDGRVAFVVSSFTPEFDVIDVPSKTVIARVPVVSPFSPNLAVSADGREVWMTHKDVGKVSVIDAQTFKVRAVVDTGPITNHVALIDRGDEHLAFVTVGGLNQVKVFSREDTPRLLTTIATGALPHGIWPSDDQTRVYVGLENADAVAVIDVEKRAEIARIASGQAPQALVYVSGAAPDRAPADAAPLQPLGEAQRPVVLTLTPPANQTGGGLVVVRQLGLVDTIDINLFGLDQNKTYVLSLDDGGRTPLAVLKTNPKGGGAAQVTGPVRRSTLSPAHAAKGRKLIVSEDAKNAPIRLSATLP